MIEAVPNVSEGRRADVVRAAVEAVEAVPGVWLLDRSSDASHNRTVITLAGDPDPLREALRRLFDVAVARIDLRRHRGAHPRIGAVDVVPFVPLGGAPMEACVELAHATGRDVAERLQVPVLLYEEAAAAPARRRLEHVRRGSSRDSRRSWPNPAGGRTTARRDPIRRPAQPPSAPAGRWWRST